ncbi:substrate-binding domain-containing protein [Christensenella hongkongensis]|uniref:substrate-binding domain-containing protein n=1 Tax=Christensenella hongkongensis TaxID=270498 RepID=UPI0026716FEA|nr:substrate-binding domain-containing protein [Christensenella hongkongensis]
MKKKLVAILGVVLACVLVVTACAGGGTMPSASASTEASTAPSESAEASPAASESKAAGGDMTVELVAKGFQHQFWQVVKKGAEAAATDLGVTINFQGPPSESDIQAQVDMLNSALSKNPSAICLAALATDSVTSQLADAQAAGIPIIGFDSGVPDAPAGQVAATAATDNAAAAGIAAEEMMKDAAFMEKVKAATADKPVRVAVLSQDATSTSVTQRTQGFIDTFKAAAEEIFPDQVSVEGHDLYAAKSAKDPAVIISVHIAPTTDAADLKNIGSAALGEENLIGVFCSNEGSVTGFLNATNDGADLDKENGKYKDLTVAGFDAGKTQKTAVKNGWFLGSVTQDPYQIGYQAVDLAVKAAKGEKVSDVDTGAKWYNASNIDSPEIADLVYD